MPDAASFYELRKFLAPEFVFGIGALRLAGQYARNLGGRKPLIVSDPGVKAAGWVQKVQESVEAAGLGHAVYARVTPNPRVEEASAGAERYLREHCDMIIAVGGGSALDAGKAIGVIASNGGDLHNYFGVDNVHAPMPPMICIPTTAGTAADVSQFAVISDQKLHRKLLIISKAVVPDISLVDPSTLTTVDAQLTACTGVDALAHAIEAYVSLGHSPVTDVHALEAVRLVRANLLKSLAEPQNLEYRSGMMLASLEAGLAFSNASLGAVHAMAHSLGGVLDLPHGQCNAMLLDRVMDFNFPETELRYRDIALALGMEVSGLSPRELRAHLTAEIHRLLEAAGIYQPLSQVGVHRTEVHELADFAVNDPCIVTNPRTPSQRDIEVIYEESL